MGLAAIVLANQRFYARKTLPVIVICGLILSIPIVSSLLVSHIRLLANKPLAALNTELILQHDRGDKDSAGVRTRGLVEPFNLHSFNYKETKERLATVPGVENFSTALVLWQFDPKNNLTVVGINPDDPPVGFRTIESLIIKGRFFKSIEAREVLLERHFAALYGYKPGTFFNLAGHNLKIIGLVDFKEESNLSSAAVFLPFETALILSRQKEAVVNQVFLSLASSTNIDEVRRAIAESFPDFSLISKDSLYKNLTAFNQLIYRGGHLMVMAVVPIALLLLIWALKIYRLEFAGQKEVLDFLGWPKSCLRRWLVLDICFLLAAAAVITAAVSAFVYWGLLPHLNIGPLLDQGFHL